MIQARAPAWVRTAGWRIEDKALVVEFETDADSAFHDLHQIVLRLV